VVASTDPGLKKHRELFEAEVAIRASGTRGSGRDGGGPGGAWFGSLLRPASRTFVNTVATVSGPDD